MISIPMSILMAIILINFHSFAAMISSSKISLRMRHLNLSGNEANNTYVPNSYYVPQFKLNFTGQCRTYQRPCQICEGDCETDLDCDEGLACFIRDSKTPGEKLQVPGCSDNPRHLFAKDFCYNATLSPCQDMVSFYDNNGTSRQCPWVGEALYKKLRCNTYGIFCRETCGYCRVGRRRKQKLLKSKTK